MKEIIRKKGFEKSADVIGPFCKGSSAENIHKVAKALWEKFSDVEKKRYNDLHSMFYDSFNYHPKMVKDKDFNAYRDTIAHNFACLVVWDERSMNKSKCKHSWTKAQGVGGGHIFNYCNKCGATK